MVKNSSLDTAFRISVGIKGFDGVLEMVGGIALIFVPASIFHGIIAELLTYEITSDNHALIAHWLTNIDAKFSHGTPLFLIIYLLAHGAIKVMLATALLREKYQLYPFAIAFLLLFIIYQSYLIGANHSLTLTALTLFDCLVTWLTYQEYKRHRMR